MDKFAKKSYSTVFTPWRIMFVLLPFIIKRVFHILLPVLLFTLLLLTSCIVYFSIIAGGFFNFLLFFLQFLSNFSFSSRILDIFCFFLANSDYFCMVVVNQTEEWTEPSQFRELTKLNCWIKSKEITQLPFLTFTK